MRKISPAGARRKAWKAFSKYIRTRDPQCITCGARTTEAGHFLHTTDNSIGKTPKTGNLIGGNEVWFNEKNVHGQCTTCNKWNSGRRDVYAIKLEEKYGHGILQDLYKLFNTVKKWHIDELREIAETYEDKLKTLQKGS